jgi:hypothetical protein
MSPAFETLVAVCERMRHLTGTLELIRGQLLAEATGEVPLDQVPAVRQTARGLYLHAVGLRQRTAGDLSATVRALAEEIDPVQAEAEGAELLSVCRDLAVTLRAVDAALAEFKGHIEHPQAGA